MNAHNNNTYARVIHPLISNPEIVVVLMDCSISMWHRFKDVPLKALNSLLSDFQSGSKAYRTYVHLVGFGERASTIISLQSVKTLKRVRKLEFTAGTRLYATTCEALETFLVLDAALVAASRQPKTSVVLITDGYDNVSPHGDERRLRGLSRTAFERGFDLRLYTLGVNARMLAQYTGFPEESAQELVPEPPSLYRTMHHIAFSTAGSIL